MKIRNINPYRDIKGVFVGNDLPECVRALAEAIYASEPHLFSKPECFQWLDIDDLCRRLREGADFEVIEE